MNAFGGYTGINLSIHLSMCSSVLVSVCVQNTNVSQSFCGGIKSQLVTALVSFWAYVKFFCMVEFRLHVNSFLCLHSYAEPQE